MKIGRVLEDNLYFDEVRITVFDVTNGLYLDNVTNQDLLGHTEIQNDTIIIINSLSKWNVYRITFIKQETGEVLGARTWRQLK
jgi:hypothetical protein